MFEKMKIRYLFGLHVLALVTVVALMVGISNDPVFAEVIIQTAFYIVVPLVFFGYYFREHGVSVRSVAFTRGVQHWLPLMGVVVALSMVFSIGIFWLQVVALMPIAPGLVEFLLEPAAVPGGTLFLAFTALSIGVIGPIAEEFIFRGVLLNRLIAKTSLWAGVFVSSGLFAVLHANAIGAFLFGVIASFLYLRTRNLMLPILLHIFHNSSVLLLAVAMPASTDLLELAQTTADSNVMMWLSVVLTFTGGMLIWIIFRLAKGLEEQEQLEWENEKNQPSEWEDG